VITRLLVLGATGDLAGRFLFPALARLRATGQLPDDLHVVGAAPQHWADETFRDHVAARLAEHAADVPAAVRRALLDRLRYRAVDLSDPVSVAEAVWAFDPGSGDADSLVTSSPVAVYLALPPSQFPAAVGALGAVGLPSGSRIAVEKPFGADLAGAVALNSQLAQLVRTSDGVDDHAVFRVDHALAVPTVADLLALRAPSGVLAAVWDSEHIEQVDILWEETLGLEGRADFYDRAGVVRDVLQNHLLQVFAMVAAELPADPTARELHDAKLDVFRSARPLSPADVATRTRRARYTAGQLVGPGGTSGSTVPDYVDEDGVDPARGTETYAELVFESDRPRWAGTRFVLRAGKALAVPRKGVLLHFGEAVDLPDADGTGRVCATRAWIGLDGPPDPDPQSPTLVTPPEDGELAAYTRVLTDVLTGGSSLSVSGQESEQAWRIVEPVLDAWANGAAPLLEYPAGSAGPSHLAGAADR